MTGRLWHLASQADQISQDNKNFFDFVKAAVQWNQRIWGCQRSGVRILKEEKIPIVAML
jgi:hypothetical protein